MIQITDTPAVPRQRKAFSARRAGAFGRGIFNLILMALTIRDIRRRSDEEIKGKRKFWMMAAFAPPIGPIAYFLFGRQHNAPQEIPLSFADSAPQADVTSL